MILFTRQHETTQSSVRRWKWWRVLSVSTHLWMWRAPSSGSLPSQTAGGIPLSGELARDFLLDMGPGLACFGYGTGGTASSWTKSCRQLDNDEMRSDHGFILLLLNGTACLVRFKNWCDILSLCYIKFQSCLSNRTGSLSTVEWCVSRGLHLCVKGWPLSSSRRALALHTQGPPLDGPARARIDSLLEVMLRFARKGSQAYFVLVCVKEYEGGRKFLLVLNFRGGTAVTVFTL